MSHEKVKRAASLLRNAGIESARAGVGDDRSFAVMMSPEEKEQWQKEFEEGLKERLDKLKEQMKPFQERHNCLRRDDSFWNRRLD